ncbi:MAG: DUF3043 domain-containing protein [Actinomycetia bacterium]|nr:DUF3043 domain-containing protein [Actinomycetes bacterium]
MKLLGRNNDDPEGSQEDGGTAPTDDRDDATSDATSHGSSGQRATTAPKGKPTPKRSAASRKRGPVAPAPLTSAQARRRRKELGGPKLSREEKKAQRSERRTVMSQRRERMMAGEAAYLLPRDQGPVRKYVRDIVDSRRNILGLFMPSALGLVFVMLAVPSVQVQQLLSPAMLVLVLIMVIDGFVLGRKVNRLADEKFGENSESGWKLGFYAASRASQLRRMRAPRPQVERGASVV